MLVRGGEKGIGIVRDSLKGIRRNKGRHSSALEMRGGVGKEGVKEQITFFFIAV